MKILTCLLFLTVTLWLPLCYGAESTPVAGDFSRAPVLAELEKQVKSALKDYGFPGQVVERLYFSGTIALIHPALRKENVKGLSKKYTCTAESNIRVIDKKQGFVVCTVSGAFDDIGRTPATARKYALGKVLRALFFCIKEKRINELQANSSDSVFVDLEHEEALLRRHVEAIAKAVDQIADDMQQMRQ